MKQITILAENKKDLMADVTQLLANAGVDIDSITGDNYGEQAIVTVTVRNYAAALNAIEKRADLQVMSEDALLVRINDELGALAKLSRRFADAGINIRSIRFVERHLDDNDHGHALVAIATERTEEALELVRDILVS